MRIGGTGKFNRRVLYHVRSHKLGNFTTLHRRFYMDVSKNRGKNPKMDGENDGNPIKMDDLGVS